MSHPSVMRASAPAWALAAALALAPLSAACDDSPSSPSDNGTLQVLLTDAPLEDIDEVNVFVTSVTVKRENRNPEELSLSLDGNENPVDLLELDDRVIVLATGSLEPGDYEFLQVNLSEAQSFIVEDGVVETLRVPSREIKVLHPFTIDEDQQTSITLDFDASQSLVQLGSGDWLLQPVIVVTGASPGG